MPRKRKKMRQEKQRKRGAYKAKSKHQDCSLTFKPQNPEFCFLHMPELRKLRPRSVRPVTACWYVLALYSRTANRKPLD